MLGSLCLGPLCWGRFAWGRVASLPSQGTRRRAPRPSWQGRRRSPAGLSCGGRRSSWRCSTGRWRDPPSCPSSSAWPGDGMRRSRQRGQESDVAWTNQQLPLSLPRAHGEGTAPARCPPFPSALSTSSEVRLWPPLSPPPVLRAATSNAALSALASFWPGSTPRLYGTPGASPWSRSWARTLAPAVPRGRRRQAAERRQRAWRRRCCAQGASGRSSQTGARTRSWRRCTDCSTRSCGSRTACGQWPWRCGAKRRPKKPSSPPARASTARWHRCKREAPKRAPHLRAPMLY